MTFQQELASWKTPAAVALSKAPAVGDKAPTSSKLHLPNPNGKPTIITFLRHCGCPFAEKTFQQLRKLADKHKDVNFVAVSHSDEPATEKWIIAVGGQWDTQVVVDAERELYGRWGLGISSAWHVLNPWSMYSAYKLGKKEKIWNLPTESGSRWQTSGSFAVDKEGIVRWVKVNNSADEIPDFNEALRAVGVEV